MDSQSNTELITSFVNLRICHQKISNTESIKYSLSKDYDFIIYIATNFPISFYKKKKNKKTDIAMYDCQKKTDESIPFVFF